MENISQHEYDTRETPATEEEHHTLKKIVSLSAPLEKDKHFSQYSSSAHNVSKQMFSFLENADADAASCEDSDAENSSANYVSIYDQLSETEIDDIETFIADSVCDYLKAHIRDMSYPLFHEEMVEQIAYFLYCDWVDVNICGQSNYREILEWVDCIATQCYNNTHIPFRSLKHCDADALIIPRRDTSAISQIIHQLRAIPQPTQKTEEWYASRHNMLTASNVWKALNTDAQFNSLVYEKCKPFDALAAEKMGSTPNPTSKNPMHWGVKYEPVSIMLYEKKYGTSVADFGCIPHANYPYLGASPDGINVDMDAKHLYGRMIEVKNIVNREIDGVPLEPYWIQMQIQMEVCDLDECDFIETRFAEFENENDFYEYEATNGEKGVILYLVPKTKIGEIPDFSSPSHKAKYVYMPLDIPTDHESVNGWIAEQKQAHANTHVIYYTMYWRLDEFSCVLVLRNREWFAAVQPQIEHCWRTILREREEGYEHRASAKKRAEILPTEVVHMGDQTQSHYIKNLPNTKHMCLVKLDAEE